MRCYYIFIFLDTLLQFLCFLGNLSFIPTIGCDYLHVSMVAFYGTKQKMQAYSFYDFYENNKTSVKVVDVSGNSLESHKVLDVISYYHLRIFT